MGVTLATKLDTDQGGRDGGGTDMVVCVSRLTVLNTQKGVPVPMVQ